MKYNFKEFLTGLDRYHTNHNSRIPVKTMNSVIQEVSYWEEKSPKLFNLTKIFGYKEIIRQGSLTHFYIPSLIGHKNI